MDFINLWCEFPRRNPGATARIFCFPYAGGSASIYRSWPQFLPSNTELIALQLPGRGNRIKEPLEMDINPLLDKIQRAILPYLDRPYAFFGHSMGGLLSLELARRITKLENVLFPNQLILSACSPPHAKSTTSSFSNLSDEEFLKKIHKLNGTPKEVFEHQELRNLILPILRADFAVCGSYKHSGIEQLNCPIHVYAGIDDKISIKNLMEWRRYTAANFMLKVFPGDHFFINSQMKSMLDYLKVDLNQVV